MTDNRDPLNTVDRLLLTGKEYDSRANHLRKRVKIYILTFQKKIIEEEAACTGTPDINTNYVSKRERVPVVEREAPPRDFDKELKERRKQHPPAESDQKECTFNPNINKKSKNSNRNVDDLLKWGDEKRFKLANRRLVRLNDSDMKNTFAPGIDDRSRKIAGRRHGEVHDRLIQCGKDRRKKVKNMLKAEKDKMFAPKISAKSRELANGMRDDDLLKIDNGKTTNLDFWEALPKGAKSLTLKTRGVPCTNDEDKCMIYRCGAEDEFIKNWNRNPKGKTNPQ